MLQFLTHPVNKAGIDAFGTSRQLSSKDEIISFTRLWLS